MESVLVPKLWLEHLQKHCVTCPLFENTTPDVSVTVADAPRSKRHTPPNKARSTITKRSTDHDLSTTEGSRSKRHTPPNKARSTITKRSTDHDLSTTEGSRKKSRKQTVVLWFVKQIPQPNSWRQRQLDLNLVEADDYVQLIRTLSLDEISDEVATKAVTCRQKSVLDFADAYSQRTAFSLRQAELQRCCANFQALVFLSYCQILAASGVESEVVDTFVQRITNLRENERRRLLQSASWVNEQIVELAKAGWDICRATELFFLSKRFDFSSRGSRIKRFSDAVSLSYLIEIRSKENASTIVSHLEKEEFIAYQYDDCLTPTYTIPGLISELARASNVQIAYGLDCCYELCF